MNADERGSENADHLQCFHISIDEGEHCVEKEAWNEEDELCKVGG
jgi:hypothetical protein